MRKRKEMAPAQIYFLTGTLYVKGGLGLQREVGMGEGEGGGGLGIGIGIGIGISDPEA
jgi:hypothetical protein